MYENKIIAFVDILGFKELVRQSELDSRVETTINKVMNNIYSYKTMNDEGEDGGLTKYGVQVTIFSDSAVISYPLNFSCGSLFSIMMDLIHMQQEVLYFGILLRGGITIGSVYHEGNIIYGPAMVDAYKLESECAINPRIIFTEDTLMRGIKACPEHINEFDIHLLESIIKKDYDGYYYLDYLGQSQEFDDGDADYIVWLNKVKDHLIKYLNMYANNSSGKKSKILDKYKWVLNYWNDTVSNEFIIHEEDYLKRYKNKK